MKPVTTYKPIHTFALVMMALYVFVFITHIFFLPNLNTNSSINHNCFLKRKTETYINLQRTDKTVINENLVRAGKNNPGSFILLFTKAFVSSVKQVPASQLLQFIPDHHYVYLANRVIRI